MGFESNLGAKGEELSKQIALAMKEIGVVGKASCQANCKVRTGNLRRSHTFKVNGNSVTIGVTKLAPYGVYVEFKPPTRGGRPWFRRTLQAENKNFQTILKAKLGKIND